LNAYSGNLVNMGDLELLYLCRDGHESAMHELYYRYSKPVFGYLLNILGSREDAEEVLADVFIKMWKSAGRFRGECKVTSWIYRIAANSAKDMMRLKKRNYELSIEDTILSEMDIIDNKSKCPENEVIEALELKDLMQALQKLNLDDRTILYLYHFRELEYRDISKITGIKTNNLKTKLFRARQKLKKIFMENNHDAFADELSENPTAASGLCKNSPELA
jgi:RNA polymerase sigma-70 factor, ECF subfamily